jgi:tetratricopeptide (TPR) repeat protein
MYDTLINKMFYNSKMWPAECKLTIYRKICSSIKNKHDCCNEVECAWEGSRLSRSACKSRKFVTIDACSESIDREFKKYISESIKSEETTKGQFDRMFIYNKKFTPIIQTLNYTPKCKEVIQLWMGTAGQKQGKENASGYRWRKYVSKRMSMKSELSNAELANALKEQGETDIYFENFQQRFGIKELTKYHYVTANNYYYQPVVPINIRSNIYHKLDDYQEALGHFKTMYKCANILSIDQTLLFRGNDSEFEFEDIEKLTATSLSVAVLNYYKKGNPVFIYIPNKKVFGLAIDNFGEYNKGNPQDSEILLINPVVKKINDEELRGELGRILKSLGNDYEFATGYADDVSVYEYLGYYTDDIYSNVSSSDVRRFSHDNKEDISYLTAEEEIITHGFKVSFM